MSAHPSTSRRAVHQQTNVIKIDIIIYLFWRIHVSFVLHFENSINFIFTKFSITWIGNVVRKFRSKNYRISCVISEIHFWFCLSNFFRFLMFLSEWLWFLANLKVRTKFKSFKICWKLIGPTILYKYFSWLNFIFSEGFHLPILLNSFCSKHVLTRWNKMECTPSTQCFIAPPK